MYRANVFSIIVLTLALTSYNCSESYVEIKVTDFGAIPNDGKDDAAAIISAIKSVKAGRKNILVFEKGSYDIFGNQTDERGRFKSSIEIRDINDLIIEGNGSELIGHDFSTMFYFSGCKNLSIKNLFIDWDPLPFSQGKVVETSNDYIDIEVTEPFKAQAGLRTEGLLGYDPELRRIARRYTDHYQKGFEKLTELSGPQKMRLFIGRDDRFTGKLPSVGNFIIVRHQIYGNQSFQFASSENIRIENVTIYSNPGMGIIGNHCRDIYISNLNVMIRPGSGRWMSTTADATHFIGCRGTIAMENCMFEGMGDDATNINSGRYMIAEDRFDEKTLLIVNKDKNSTPVLPQAGDLMELSNEFTAPLPYASLTVKSAISNEENKSITVEFTNDLPDQLLRYDFIANASSCPAVQIRGCTVIRNRSRGFIIKSRNVIIENCTFQDVSAGGGVVLESDVTAWWESIAAGNVTIRNNRFINCRFEPAYISGVIESHTNPGGEKAPAGVFKDITIEKNIIQGTTGAGIKLGSADQVNILSNIIENCQDPGILIYNSNNVSLTGNIIKNCLAGLKIDEGCDESTIKAEKNIGF